MSGIESVEPRLRRIRLVALAAGLAAVASGIVAALFQPSQFFRSYLIGYTLLLGTALGSAGLLMLHHLTSGYWGLITRRIFESAARTLPLIAVFTIPLLFGLSHLYAWTNPQTVAADPLLQVKQFYLNTPFFLVRQLVYFLIWILVALSLTKWSARQDASDDPFVLERLRFFSGPGLLLYCLAITFAAVDWVMSLEPHYFSTTFGFRLITGHAVSAAAFAIAVAMLLSSIDPIAPLINRKRLRDLGNILLTLIMLWAYIAFTEYLIVWAGNIPEETSWFIRRFHAGWGAFAWFLIIFHFFVPFFFLLQRSVKHRPLMLAGVALWLLLMRWSELLWIVGPVHHQGFFVHWLDIVVPAGLAGIWLAVFLHQLTKRPLVPVYDPLLREPVDGESRVTA